MIAEIVGMRINGATSKAIAEKYRISESAVYRVLKANGLGRPRLTVDQVAEMVAMRKSGSKISEIVEVFGVTKSCVGRILKKYGLSRNKTTPEERQAIVKAHNDGYSVKDLVEIFGRQEGTIEQILRTKGVFEPTHFRRVNGTPIEEEICRRYQRGDTTISILTDLKVGRKTLESIVKRHGIQRPKRESNPAPVDFDGLTPCDTFPKTDLFDLTEEERDRLEEIRAAKIKNWHKAHEKERKYYEDYD